MEAAIPLMSPLPPTKTRSQIVAVSAPRPEHWIWATEDDPIRGSWASAEHREEALVSAEPRLLPFSTTSSHT